VSQKSGYYWDYGSEDKFSPYENAVSGRPGWNISESKRYEVGSGKIKSGWGDYVNGTTGISYLEGKTPSGGFGGLRTKFENWKMNNWMSSGS
jgi:hypothetical protein